MDIDTRLAAAFAATEDRGQEDEGESEEHDAALAMETAAEVTWIEVDRKKPQQREGRQDQCGLRPRRAQKEVWPEDS